MRCSPARSSHTHPDAPDSTTGDTDSAASSSAECAELSAAAERLTTTRSEETVRACAIVIPGRIPISRAGIETASRSACGARLLAIASTLSSSAGFERTIAAIEKSATRMHAIRAIETPPLLAAPSGKIGKTGIGKLDRSGSDKFGRFNWIDQHADASVPTRPAHLVPRDHCFDGESVECHRCARSELAE